MNYRLLLLLACVSLVLTGRAQEPAIDHLFYCNSGQNIEDLWIIDSETALGKRMEATSGRKDYWVRDMVLIDRQGLIKDSVSFNFSNSGFVQIDRVWRTGPYSFFVEAGGRGYNLEIEGNRLKVSAHLASKKKPQPPRNYKRFRDQAVVTFKNVVVGYQREQYREFSAKKDHKNHPVFWLAKVNNGQIGQPQPLNPDPEVVTDDLFYDWRDWEHVGDRTQVFSNCVGYNNNKLTFMVVRSNLLYTYDLRTGKAEGYRLLPVSPGESCMYYHDGLENRHYVVKKTLQKQYMLYRTDEGFRQAEHLATLDFMPRAITGGKIHREVEEKEKGRKFKCHYLLPLAEAAGNRPVQVLETVEIN